MAPFLRDEGPPVSQQTIQRARESLPLEFGNQIVNESGREVLLVRVPKAKPDYLHDLGEVAFYVGLDQIKATKDILLIGHERTARLEPQQLRDYIRAQQREDVGVVDAVRRGVDRQYGVSTVQSPSNHLHVALAMRIPRDTIAEIAPEDVTALRQVLANSKKAIDACQYAYIVANRDHERLGRRVLLELLGLAPEPAAPAAPAPVEVAPAPAPAPAAAPAAFAFPRGPSAAATSAPAPAATASVPSGPFGSLMGGAPAAPAPKVAPVPEPAPAPVVAEAPPAPAAPAAPAQKEVHEEYEIVSKPKAPAAPKPAPAPLALAVDPAAQHETHDEYEIVSKPKPKEPEAPVPAAAEEHHDPEKKVIHASEEFEVFTSKPKPREKPTITPPGQGGFMAAFDMAAAAAPKKTKEYSIMDGGASKAPPSLGKLPLPGASPAATPAPSAPAPLTGFAAAIQAAAHQQAQVQAPAPVLPTVPHVAAPPMPTSAQSATAHPQVFHGSPTAAAPGAVINLAALGITAPPQAAAPSPSPSPPPQPVAAPAAPAPSGFHVNLAALGVPVQQAAPAAVAPPVVQLPAQTAVQATPPPAAPDDPRVIAPRSVPVPATDSGAVVVVPTTPVPAAEVVLAHRFKESGYEVVEGLKAQGHQFAFAAHKTGGRRVLVKRVAEFGVDDASALAQLVTALGADFALVVADRTTPGVRLATWGTRIEVVAPETVPSLTF